MEAYKKRSLLGKTFIEFIYQLNALCLLNCRNLSRMCQLPVMNPLRNNGNASEFDDPSEPIYTDPSLFERSRYVNEYDLLVCREAV